jgi:hypothetical protein
MSSGSCPRRRGEATTAAPSPKKVGDALGEFEAVLLVPRFPDGAESNVDLDLGVRPASGSDRLLVRTSRGDFGKAR